MPLRRMPPPRGAAAVRARAGLYAGLLLLATVASRAVRASDFDIAVSEIHYHPLGGGAEEFVELLNRGAVPVDLDGWAFARGVGWVFPPATVIAPGERLVVAADPARLGALHGDVRVQGPWRGRLSNGGEVLLLLNDEGEEIQRIHWDDEAPWPARSDGLGPSLERISPRLRPGIPRHWRASAVLDGTPGAPNSQAAEPPRADETVVVPEDAVWSYRIGDAPYPAGWRDPGFDASDWSAGPTGIGFGDDDDRTVVESMQDTHFSFAARHVVEVDAGMLEDVGSLVLEVDYDDAFVAWLNGVEVARENLGEAGAPVPYDRAADDGHEAGTPEAFRLPVSLLKEGPNVLAAQVHNEDVDSSDLSFIPRLAGRRGPAPREPAAASLHPRVTEVAPPDGDRRGFVELHNPGTQPVDLAGYRIASSRGGSAVLPPGFGVPAGGLRVVEDDELGFPPVLPNTVWYILEPDGRTIVDAFATRAPPSGGNGISAGRLPERGPEAVIFPEPTPGAPNQLAPAPRVVVSELFFHPPFAPAQDNPSRDDSDLDQWLELHNATGAEVDLTGWSLRDAVTYDFPAGTSLGPGDRLVIARSRDRFLAAHPGVDPAAVVGGWSRALAHAADTVELRDARGNLADRVPYGDGTPVNDEEPEDGVDDGTFRGSPWPPGAQGTGRTIELVHPGLDNALGGAWREGPEGGTPGAPNAAARADPVPVVGDVDHAPPVPRSGDAVRVTCRVSAGRPITRVAVLWEHDGGGPSGEVELRDDGTGTDARAGDGRFTGEIPPQPDATVVAFRIEARHEGGATTVVPQPPETPPYGGFRGPFFLYRVQDAEIPRNASTNYWIVMTQADREELASRSEESNVLLPATFISLPWRQSPTAGEPEVRHLTGIRYRGSSARRDERKSYRVAFAADRTFQGIRRLNLNARSIDNALVALDLYRRAGIPTPQAWTVNLTFGGELDPRYLRKERLDEDFLERWFGDGADDGNLYRAFDPDDDSELPFEGDLSYLGPDPEAYRPYYVKLSNEAAADWTDIVELTEAFDPELTPDGEFADRLEELIDPRQWVRYFAVQALLGNDDGSLHNRTGEDYDLYRVPADAGIPSAGHWVLIPWDLEESFSERDEPIFRTELPAPRRFLTHPRFAPLFYGELLDLRYGVASRREMRKRFDLVDFLFPFAAIDGIDSFLTDRLGFVDERVPTSLETGSGDTEGAPLVPPGATWRYRRGTAEPAGAPLDWTLAAYDDAGWPEGPSGFGYGDGDDATVLSDMEGSYTTVYLRHRFDVPDPEPFRDSLRLVVDYDDAFIAWLNGVEIARRGVGGGAVLPHDATADDTHEAGSPEVIDVSGAAGALVAGTNVLAIQALNADIDSSDLTLRASLEAGSGETAGCGTELWATGPAILLCGRSHAARTRAVQVDGRDASWNAVGATWTATVPLSEGSQEVLVESLGPGGRPFASARVTVRRPAGGFASVDGAVDANSVWRAGDGPFLLDGTVRVAPGARLQIEPGAVVLGEEDASLVVEGQLLAGGDPERPVLFRARRCDARWGGIALEGTGTGPAAPVHILRHCDFTFGDTADGQDGCVAPEDARLLVDGCRFSDLTANAIDATRAHLEVRDSIFERIHEGVHGTDSTVMVVDSHFRGMVGDNDAVDFDGDGDDRSRIVGCTFRDGSDDGIDLSSTSVDIRDNVFVNVQDKALSLQGPGTLGPPAVAGNVVHRCGTAIALKNGVEVVEGHHNTLVGNQEGLRLFAKAGAGDGGHAMFHSNIIWSNEADVLLDDLSTLELTHSDVSMPWPGPGNISLDPRFRDAATGDFALRPDSPCIGTGRDGTDMGAVPSSGPGAGPFLRSDADASGTVDLTDAVFTLGYLFQGGDAPSCPDAADANDDGVLDVSDPVRTLLFLFAGGPEPPPPWPAPGPDPTDDPLACP